MQAIDEKTVLFFQSCRCDALTFLFKIFIPLEFWIWVALVLVAYDFFQSRVLRAPVISFVLARKMAFFCFNVAKDYFHRPRPFLTISQAVPIIKAHGFSFPSGHATLAMASAIVLAHHFPKSRGVVYALAVLVGLSRVYLGVHYLSDVLGGYILGALMGWAGILLERCILSLAQGVPLGKKKLTALLIFAVMSNPAISQAKGGDDQNQIILLNDSAAALEDTDPKLSRELTAFADEKEREWEAQNAGQVKVLPPMTDKDIFKAKERVKLLHEAAQAIVPDYPLIAKALDKMADDLNGTIQIKK